MKTTIDIQNILYQVLSSSSNIVGSISGGIYKQRPLNSDKEDIVVGSLPVNNDQLQQAVANVNIHVPNKVITINGSQDNTQPDAKRMNELTRLVWGLLDETYHDTYWFFVQQQNIFSDGDEYYSNIRLNFYSENIN